MTLATQDLYNERADAYAKMCSLTWQLVNLRGGFANLLVTAQHIHIPPVPFEKTSDYQEVKLAQLAEKARWLKVSQKIRSIEEAHSDSSA